MGDKEEIDEVDSDLNEELGFTDETYAEYLLQMEADRLERARSGDCEAGRVLLMEVIRQLESPRVLKGTIEGKDYFIPEPINHSLRGYLIEILKASLDAPADGVAKAMHISSRPHRQKKRLKQVEFSRIYIASAAGEELWKTDLKRHRDLITDIADLMGVSRRVVEMWFKEWRHGVDVFGLPDPPPDDDDFE